MKTHMENEIFEQANCLKKAYIYNKSIFEQIVNEIKSKRIKLVVFAARGSSDNSGVFFKYLCETLYQVPVSFAAASVITLYNSKIDYQDALVIGVSQSGQAKDVLAVIDEANEQKAMTITLTNYLDSPLAKAGKYHLFLNTGEEKSVAATKTYMTQMYLLGLLTGFISNNLDLINALRTVPEVLNLDDKILDSINNLSIAHRNINSAFVLSRGYLYAIAKELALKLQETTYIQALSYSIADFYHGPFALVSKEAFCILLIPEDESFTDALKMLDDLNKVGANCLLITSASEVSNKNTILLPKVSKFVAPFLYMFVSQYFCLNLALAKGLNPDKPRGLKKVTVTK